MVEGNKHKHTSSLMQNLVIVLFKICLIFSSKLLWISVKCNVPVFTASENVRGYKMLSGAIEMEHWAIMD